MANGSLDEDIVLSTICILLLLLDDKKQTKEEEKKRSTRVRPWLARRKEGEFYHQLLTEISVEDTPAFHELLRMTKTQFQGLVDTLSPGSNVSSSPNFLSPSALVVFAEIEISISSCNLIG